jgi:hypothetical protein
VLIQFLKLNQFQFYEQTIISVLVSVSELISVSVFFFFLKSAESSSVLLTLTVTLLPVRG